MSRLRITFIARAYPPTLGGMENFAFQLREHLDLYADVTPIINNHGKKALPVFLPYAVAKATRLARAGRTDAVHLADALLAPAGAAIRAATGVVVTSSVCGLDVTFPNRAYQAIVPRSLRHLDAVMPISAATERAMISRTGAGVRSTVIPLGINPLAKPGGSHELQPFAETLAGKRVLITTGRLIERKGHAWFVSHVLPALPRDVVYVVAGTGPERDAIELAAQRAGVSERVIMLGRVPDQTLAAAYAAADAFVMPNIPVAGDMEGFGLVALEASSAGLPVIASNLEGIADAVHAGRNGVLPEPLDAAGWIEAVSEVLDRPRHVRVTYARACAAYTSEMFSWDLTARRYADIISGLVLERAPRRRAVAMRAK